MRRLLSHRPSAGAVIAFIALFVALGGAGYAAKKINGKNLKNRSVTGKKLKRNTVRGAEIRESSLGRVPSALTAVKTDQLQQVGSFKRVTATDGANDDAARTAAPEVALFKTGVLDVYGKCFRNTTTNVVNAKAYIRTTEDGAILDSDEDNLDGDPPGGYLNTGTAETAREVQSSTAGANTATINLDDNSTFGAMAPGGSEFSGQVNSAAKNGTLAAGDGVYGAGHRCLYSGYIIK